MENALIAKNILKILVFFDLFDHPLTLLEIQNYLGGGISLAEVWAGLADLLERQKIAEQSGFYFLTGREVIITIRKQRFNYTNRKLKIARLFSAWLKLWPFVKIIAVSNSIGDRNLRRESDIDFFIIASPGRLWLTRFLAAGLAKLIGQRPTQQKKQDKICLSFYLSASQLNIETLKLSGSDPYFDYWRRNLLVVYDRGGWEEKFLAANGLVEEATPLAGDRTGKLTAPIRFFSWLGDGLENLLRTGQLKIMPPALKEALNNSRGVVANNQVLKFYLTDRRTEFLNRFNEKINELSR